MNNGLKLFPFYCLLLLLPMNLFAQYSSASSDVGFKRTFDELPLKVEIEIINENIDSNWYALSWVSHLDSVFNIPGQPLEELHCFIRDSKGVVGSYTGQSTPATFCYFQTADEEVSVYFMRRKNKFAIGNYNSSQSILEDENGTDVVSQMELLPMDWNCNQSEYEVLGLKLKDTYPKAYTLKNNDNILQLTHINKGAMVPDEMPCIGCCGYDIVLVTNRYYLDLKSGKMLKGQQWLNRKTIKKIVNELKLTVINPTAKYENKEGEVFTGQELIKNRKIDIEEFEINVFSQYESNKPY